MIRCALFPPGGLIRLVGILEDGKLECGQAADRQDSGPAGVPDQVGLVLGPGPVPVLAQEGRRIFNKTTEREHALGARTQFVHQLSFMFGSAHGWLGAGIGPRSPPRAAACPARGKSLRSLGISKHV